MQFLVNLDVDDLAKAVGFYAAAFGLTVGRRFGPHAVEMLGGAAPIYLLAGKPGSHANAAGDVRRYERHWTPVHLDFVVEDIDAAVARAVAAGATLEKPATTRSQTPFKFQWAHAARCACAAR